LAAFFVIFGGFFAPLAEDDAGEGAPTGAGEAATTDRGVGTL
jgi:hypothetical protein